MFRDGSIELIYFEVSLFIDVINENYKRQIADPRGRVVYGMGLRPLASWDYGFESRWSLGRLALVNVVRCQVEVCATG